MKPKGAVKAKLAKIRRLRGRWRIGDSSHCRVQVAKFEPTRSDPKDGELCSSRTKPEETLVEVRSDSDVQIDRLT